MLKKLTNAEPWPLWMIRYIGSQDLRVLDSLVKSVDGPNPEGEISNIEGAAVRELIAHYTGPGTAPMSTYLVIEEHLADRLEATLALEAFRLHDRIASNPSSPDAKDVEQGILVSKRLKDQGVCSYFLGIEAQLAYARSDIGQARKFTEEALNKLSALVDQDSVYSDQLGKNLMNLIAFTVMDGNAMSCREWIDKCNGRLTNTSYLKVALENEAIGVMQIYNNTGRFEALDRGINSYKQAISLTEENDSKAPELYQCLGQALLSRADWVPGRSDSDEAVHFLQRAVTLSPIGSSGRINRLTSLGFALSDRYERYGDTNDLDNAVQNHKKAISESADGSEGEAISLSYLGNALRLRGEIYGNLKDIDDSIRSVTKSIDWSKKAGESPSPADLNILGASYRIRYEMAEDKSDLESSLRAHRESIRLTPQTNPKFKARLANLHIALRNFFLISNDPNHLNEAIRVIEEAIRLTPSHSVDLPGYLNNLSLALVMQSKLSKDIDLSNRAITTAEQALLLSSPNSPELSMYNHCLGNAYRQRFKISEQASDYTLAAKAFGRALDLAIKQRAPLALSISYNWGEIAINKQDWKSAAFAFRTGLDAILTLRKKQLSRHHREILLKKVEGLSLGAAYAFSKLGQYDEAALAIEGGRGIMLSDTIGRYPADLDRLTELGHQDVKGRYINASTTLEELEDIELLIEGDQHNVILRNVKFLDLLHDARAKYSAALSAVRDIPGFQHFAAVPTAKDIALAATFPFAYIFAGQSHGYTIIGRSNGSFQSIILPELTIKDLSERIQIYAKAMRIGKGLVEAVDDMTEWLWDAVMGPVIDEISEECLILIPTGFLSLLPLHAAWVKDSTVEEGRRYVIDDLRINYAINSLISTQAHAVSINNKFESILLIHSPSSTSTNPLPYSNLEATSVARQFPISHQLLKQSAARNRVLEAFRTYDVVHFACHGIAAEDPLLSSILLSNDELLTVRDMLRMRLPKAPYAILSACESAIASGELGSEAIGLPAGFLKAGASGVIGSLYAVRDESTALLILRFYHYWRNQTQNIEPTEALRYAQKWLRGSTNEQLAEFLDSNILSDDGLENSTRKLAEQCYNRFALSDMPEDKPFKSPYYWAGLVYYGG